MWHNDALDAAMAHLFTVDDLNEQGVREPGDHADAPVDSLCRATASYGPFYPVGYARSADELRDADDVCERCLARWERRVAEEQSESDADTN